jgi:hypothetical protein
LDGSSGSGLQVGNQAVIISNESTGPTAAPLSTLVNGVRDRVEAGEAQNFKIPSGTGPQFSVNYAAGSDSNDVRLTVENTSAAFQNRSITTPVNVGQLVTVSGTVVEPDAQDTFTLEVNWGDGSPVQIVTAPPGSHGRTLNVTHRYASEGFYTVHLIWHDQHGAGNSADLFVTVRDAAPVVDAGGDAHVRAGTPFNRTGSFTDPGGESWTGTVDFGDGTGPQALQLFGKNKFDLRHTYANPGTYRVVVTIMDEDGGVGTDIFYVTVGKKRGHK